MATAMAAIGMLVVSSGVALMVSAAPANAEATKVNVCHATSSDTNPYVFLQVDDDSTKLQGHLMHRSDPNKRWKTAGTFNNKPHAAGDPKPDLIGDYVDQGGTAHTYDGNITEASCEATVTELETTASASFSDPTCANNNTASYTTAGDHATFALTGTVAPGQAVTVTATVADGYVFPDDAQALEFKHTFAAAATNCSVTQPPEEETPPAVSPPAPAEEVATPTPTVVHAGLLSTVGDNERMQQGLALVLAGMIVLVMAGGLGLVRPYGGKTQN